MKKLMNSLAAMGVGWIVWRLLDGVKATREGDRQAFPSVGGAPADAGLPGSRTPGGDGHG